jgi:hypothetical protein
MQIKNRRDKQERENNFPEGENPLCTGMNSRSISKLQGGVPQGAH